MPLSLQKPLFLLLWILIPFIWIMMSRSFFKGVSRKRKLLVGGLRSLLILLLGFVLADPRIMAHTDRVNLLFCLDVSESVGSEKKIAAESFIQQAITGMDEEDQAGLIVFGKHPSLEIPLKNKFEPASIRSDVNTNFTNIYEALQFALGNLPQKGENKILLFTDGNENVQNAIEMAYLAASLDVEIYPVSLASWFGKGEVFVQEVKTPATAPLETPYEVRIVVMSSKENQGELVLLKNDKLLANQPMELQPGKNVLTFADTLSEPGLYLYRAVINVPEDVFFQNNEGLSFTRGTRRSQILYLVDEGRSSNPFADTLDMQGLQLVHKSVNDLTGSIHDLLEYNAIILDNVSGESMSFTAMENIEQYVKDMGGGLMMIGGDKSFGAGYYKKTPIEEALPVFMDAPTDMTFSGLCLIFVIDKSSSMSTQTAGKSKLEMAKIAAFSSIELLNPTDTVGIVAFDSNFSWFVPITQASNRQDIADNLSQIRQSGGTNLYPALEDASKVLKEVEATRKHVIVLSDGRTEEADFRSLVRSMRESGISISTVAIGADADVDLMKSIARWGEGRSYYTDNPNTIPTIFTGETKIVTKNLIMERTMQPSLTMLSEMLQGIADGGFPAIYGQVITYPKPGASVLMKTTQGPLLAAWQYGLGRSVAFTSDLSGRWGKDWVLWDQYGKFSSQMVKWVQRKETQRNYAATIDRKGEQGTFTVDITDNQNRFMNNLDLSINLLFPSKNSQTLSLDQIAPGRYQGSFPAEEIGDYYFTLFGTEQENSGPPQVFGFGIPYTDEFTSTDVNLPLLEQLASITNGKVLTVEDIPNDVFTVQSGVKEYGTSLWKHFALAFLFLLLVDVAVRKILTLG
jgi:uncharacterized membrane protein/uncharacterized protein YegL